MDPGNPYAYYTQYYLHYYGATLAYSQPPNLPAILTNQVAAAINMTQSAPLYMPQAAPPVSPAVVPLPPPAASHPAKVSAKTHKRGFTAHELFDIVHVANEIKIFAAKHGEKGAKDKELGERCEH